MDNPSNTTPDTSRRLADRLFHLAGVVVLLLSAAAGWLAIDYRTFTQTQLNVPVEGVLLDIPPGRSVRAIANDLAERELIRHPRYFEWMVRHSGSAAHLQAGEYRIGRGVTPEGLIQLLISGKVVQHGLTIVEGWTFRQLLDAIQADTILTHTLAGKTTEEIMSALGHPNEHPEGRFLPDTYHFPRGTTDLDFLSRAYDALQQTLEHEWAERSEGLPLKTPYEALILASIVEKETGVAEERPRIAGVFVRRLSKGMRLQTDPTIIYGLGEGFDGNIRLRDLRSDTPYNTYTREGLPPTPIALPGADAIHAVLHPAAGKELYFVARGDGSHHFSVTLEEHNRAVQEFQLKHK